MSITINHQTNDISATSGSVSINGAVPSGGSTNSFSNIYVGATGSPPSGGTLLSADSSADSLYFIAGTNITFSANAIDDSITINSTGGASGITWTPNTMFGGSITVTNPAGYSTSGSTLVIVVAGATSPFLSSGSASFTQLFGVGSDVSVFYTSTGPNPGATTTISGISAYAMAYAYIAGGSSGLSGSSGFSSSTSASVSNPAPNNGSPRMVAVSTSSVLNLATTVGPASGGGLVTWDAGSGYAHPSTGSLSAAVWAGTGSWTTSATATLTSNPSSGSWSITGITSFS